MPQDKIFGVSEDTGALVGVAIRPQDVEVSLAPSPIVPSGGFLFRGVGDGFRDPGGDGEW